MVFRGFIAHHLPGRLRLKFREAKGSRSALSKIAQICAEIDGVEKVEINPITGTILVMYEPGRNGDFPEMLDRISSNGSVFTLEPEDAVAPAVKANRQAQKPSEGAASIVAAVRSLNTDLKRASDNKVDLALLLPLAAAGLALGKRRSAQGTPIWVTLTIFAFQSFLALNTPTQRSGKHAGAP
jgi:hypothetical protein